MGMTLGRRAAGAGPGREGRTTRRARPRRRDCLLPGSGTPTESGGSGLWDGGTAIRGQASEAFGPPAGGPFLNGTILSAWPTTQPPSANANEALATQDGVSIPVIGDWTGDRNSVGKTPVIG